MRHKFLVILFSAFAETLTGQSNYNYQRSLQGFEYIEIVKGNDNARLPLLIAFHYSSGNPIETISDYDSIKTPIRIVIPKGNNKKRDGFSYYPADYYQKDSLTQFYLSKICIDSLARFVLAIENKYKQKAIVSGISQGGDIALLLAIFYPELLKVSLPVAAVIPSNVHQELKSKPVKEKIPVYMFQGESDKIVSALTTIKSIKEIGNRLNIKLNTYPNVGHEISMQMKIDYSEIIDKINY